jgi:hypothetical protein
LSRLPGVLGKIAEVAGEAAALQLARELGGHELKISGRAGGKLASIVGDEAAAKIAEALGPEKITVPMAGLRGAAARRQAAARLMAQGVPASKVAQACDVHERTAWRAKAKAPAKLPLFED